MYPGDVAVHGRSNGVHGPSVRQLPPVCLHLPRATGRAEARAPQTSLNVRSAYTSRIGATAALSQPSADPRDDKSFVLSSVSEAEDESSTHQASSSQLRDQQSTASVSGRSHASSSGSQFWEDLLSSPEPEIFGGRAKSASDAAVLRRKGHLKEQDKMIEFLLAMHHTHTSEEVMLKMDRWIMEHRRDPRNSRLRRMVPTVGSFFTPLKLVEAFKEFDQFFALSRRKYVPPNFAEIRHILNIAQVTTAHCNA